MERGRDDGKEPRRWQFVSWKEGGTLAFRFRDGVTGGFPESGCGCPAGCQVACPVNKGFRPEMWGFGSAGMMRGDGVDGGAIKSGSKGRGSSRLPAHSLSAEARRGLRGARRKGGHSPMGTAFPCPCVSLIPPPRLCVEVKRPFPPCHAGVIGLGVHHARGWGRIPVSWTDEIESGMRRTTDKPKEPAGETLESMAREAGHRGICRRMTSGMPFKYLGQK